MTFAATIVAVAPGTGTPDGIVEFYDGDTLLGSVALIGGQASLNTNGLSSGDHGIEARYGGAANFASSLGSVTQTVNPASTSTTTVASSSSSPSNLGQTVTLRATVTMPSGTPTGTVTFFDGATPIGAATLVGGVANLPTATLAGGSHAIMAHYEGSAAAPPSVSTPFVQIVNVPGTKTRNTSISLSASPTTATLGQTVTFTATVAGSKYRPTGAVLFTVNGIIVGSIDGVPVTSGWGNSATATLSLDGLAHGVHTVTATYLGDDGLKGSTTTISYVVN